RRLQPDPDIALAVKGAGIADIAVVVDDSVDVRRLGPADPLQMYGKRRAGRTALDIERKRGGLDPEASGLLPAIVLDRQRVHPAEIVGSHEIEFEVARWIRQSLGDRSRRFAPPMPAHAVADDGGPSERIASARRKTSPAYRHLLADAGGGRRHHEHSWLGQ